MCLLKRFKEWRHRRRARIYEGPCVDGGVRISHNTEAPSEIVSRSLVSFSCSFSALSLIEDECLLRGVYRFEAERMENGMGCAVLFEGSHAAEARRREIRPLSFLNEVEKLIREYHVARFNGQYYKVSGLPDFFGSSVDAVYESGESICCYNNQDPFLPVELVYALCRLFGVEVSDPTEKE